MNRRRFWLYSGIIALGFMWTGSSYISQMYRLEHFLTPRKVDIVALRWNYLAQAAGIIIYSVLLSAKPHITGRRSFFVWIMVADAVLMTATLTSTQQIVVLWAGIIMNVFHGAVAGAYLTLLGAHVPQKERGRVFGFAYAAGSLGTYFLSLISQEQFIRSKHVLVAYFLCIGANSLAVWIAEDVPAQEERADRSMVPERKGPILLFLSLVLMGVLSSIGSSYQFQAVAEQKVKLEFSRAFYAIGLIGAGIATDFDRRIGAVLCYGSLVFPFFQVALRSQPSLLRFAWALSYIILGFYTVFRAVSFVDVADRGRGLIHLAGMGLAAGRIGESLSTFIPEAVCENQLYSTFLVLALFVPLTFLFFFFFERAYGEKPSADADEDTLLERFGDKYDLTKREREICYHLITGRSNAQISALLYISESTTKFHVKNILKKTACGNRIELTALFRRSTGSRR